MGLLKAFQDPIPRERRWSLQRLRPRADGILPAAERALFVRDSPYDMTADHAAGVQTGAALWGPHPRERLEPERPTHWFTTPGQVFALVESTWG